MADELTVIGGWQYAKNDVSRNVTAHSEDHDVTGNEYIDHVQSIGTSAEAVTLGDVATYGFAVFKNLDATNYVEIGITDGAGDIHAFVKLMAGEEAQVWLAAAPYAKANTAACLLNYTIFER